MSLVFLENPHIVYVAVVGPFTVHNFKKARTSELRLQSCEQGVFNWYC